MIIPLRAHSANGSLKRSVLNIDEYIKKAVDVGLTHLTLTDYSSMSASIEFYSKCIKAGITPIIGIEIEIINTVNINLYGNKYRVVLLAKNYNGYQRLIKIHNKIKLSKNSYIDMQNVYNIGGNDLIALFPCSINPVVMAEAHNDINTVEYMLNIYYNIFDDVYFGIHPCNNENYKYVNTVYLKLEEKFKIKTVIDSDIYYLNESDYIKHNLHLKSIMNDNNISSFIIKDNSHFFMTDSDIYNIDCDISKENLYRIINMTNNIANKCNVNIKIDFSLPKYKKIPLKYNNDIDAYLTDLCMDALFKKACCIANPDIYMDRLRYELYVISKLNFSGYFLIVWDIIKYAKENNIAIGPGRGSCGGSIVSWLLGITVADPIKYNLLFERFLSIYRTDIPDIDIDVCSSDRSKLKHYIVDTYGKDYCALISTIGYRKTKAALKNAARLLNIEPNKINFISREIKDSNKNIEDALKTNKKLIQYSKEYPDLFNIAKEIENIPVNESIHAAGIVVSPYNLVEKIPVRNGFDADMNISTFTKEYIERYAVKFDFLSLDLLDVINKTIHDAKIKICLDDDSFYNDQDVWNLIGSDDTDGIFQISSNLYKERMQKLKPKNIEELANCLALIRTPCITSGTDREYIDIISNNRPPTKICREYDDIMKDTYGICIYQEQLMKLCVAFGFKYEESYAIKKACGKKNEEEVSMYVDKFKNLIKQKGYGLDIQNKLVNILLNSASYSFNKSHAICYAILVYESAWLKKHYNTIFMANLLTNMYVNKNKGNVHNIVEACKKNGINFIPVDINKSDWEFKQCGEKTIRIGFCAIPIIGKRAAEEILYGRTYSSIEDFINKNKISNNFIMLIILAGCFNSLSNYSTIMTYNSYCIINNIVPDYNFKLSKNSNISFDIKNSSDVYMANVILGAKFL